MLCNNRCNNRRWNNCGWNNCGWENCNTCGNCNHCNNYNPCNHFGFCECARPWDWWNNNRWPIGQRPCRPGPAGPVGPAGPIGPIGPVGPAGPAAPTVYGGLINTTPQTLTLTAATPVIAPLTTPLPADGVTYTPANSITIEEAGDYAITYFIAYADLTDLTDTDITLAIRSNGVQLPNTAVTATAIQNDGFYLQGETIQTLPAGAVIDMTITSSATTALALGTNTTLTLIIKKLG